MIKENFDKINTVITLLFYNIFVNINIASLVVSAGG
jgi:hypothetical protein